MNFAGLIYLASGVWFWFQSNFIHYHFHVLYNVTLLHHIVRKILICLVAIWITLIRFLSKFVFTNFAVMTGARINYEINFSLLVDDLVEIVIYYINLLAKILLIGFIKNIIKFLYLPTFHIDIPNTHTTLNWEKIKVLIRQQKDIFN